MIPGHPGSHEPIYRFLGSRRFAKPSKIGTSESPNTMGQSEVGQKGDLSTAHRLKIRAYFEERRIAPAGYVKVN